MKTKLFIYSILLFLSITTFAQQAPFMVCNPAGTTCTPYTTLESAFSGANAGDYIYLPAGDFSISSWITKPIHFIGAGFDINASITTGITRISGNLIIQDTASGSTFEGFYLTGNFINYGNVNNIKFNYLNFNRTNPYYNNYGWTWNNCEVRNSVVREYLFFGDNSFYFGANNLITNSFVNSFHNLTHSTIKNCIVATYPSSNYCFYNIKSTTIKNCIIGGQGLYNSNCDNVLFLNNATTASTGQLSSGNSFCTEVDNSYGVIANDTFVTATVFTYDQTMDYHIKTTSPAYNGGDNGADMGIYGGSTPWKQGAIPSNPHIFFKNISNATDGSGNLPVQISVSTQY